VRDEAVVGHSLTARVRWWAWAWAALRWRLDMGRMAAGPRMGMRAGVRLVLLTLR